MNSFGVRVRVVVRVVVSVVDSFGVIVRIRVGIRVYVKPFCLAVKRKNSRNVIIFGRANK